MNINALNSLREQTKQCITQAILESRFSEAKDMINDAIEYQEMIGKSFEFISNNEVNDFFQAIDESEIML